MKWLLLPVLMVLSVGSLAPALAASDQFTVNQTVIAADNDAPSIPGGVSAVAVSSSQINISWSASTDNVSVAGYQLFRDGTQIATTTLLSYSDTGLLAETTYAYTVRAFDTSDNISTSSATSSATTDALTVPPTGGGSPADVVLPRIKDLKVESGQHSAHISWETTFPTRSIVMWGRTEEYELASLEERSLLSEHATRLTSLVPGVRYYFKIIALDRHNRETVLVESSFVTVSLPDTEAPYNVSDLIARVVLDDVELSWRNPQHEDFDHVRIIRRLDGYPVDPNDGVVVYEGSASSFADRAVLANNDRAYYAVFAYDRAGNESSGALVAAYKPGTPPPAPVTPSVEEGGISVLEFRDLVFRQGGNEISYIGSEVRIDGGEALTVEIPYGLLPEHLKTVMVTLASANDRNKTFSFLLRVDAGKTVYRATLAPLGTGGEYPLSLSVLDYRQQTVTTVEGTLIVDVPEATVTSPTFFGTLSEWNRDLNYLLLILMFALLLLVLYLLATHPRRKHETPWVEGEHIADKTHAHDRDFR